MQYIQRGLTLIVLSVGMCIFLVIVIMKLEVISDQSKANLNLTIADQNWENYMGQQAVLEARR